VGYGVSGLAFDSAGNLYAATLGNTIEKFTNGMGGLSSTGTTFASSGMNNPRGLAFDSAGNLYVANFFGENIEKFSNVGGVLSMTGTSFASTNGRAAFIAFGTLSPDTAAVPEIDSGSAASAVALLGCGVVMWSGRRGRKRSASGIVA
jgi:hypothetical protein